jgi:proline iminopeptidase
MKQMLNKATTAVAVPAAATGSPLKQTHVVDNRGDHLFTTLYPNAGKQTILLLHGGPGFPDDLEEVVQILRDRFQVLTFHQRGTGHSPCSSKDYSMDAYVSDIEAILNYFQIGRFHLWGHSWGGLYAQIYAQQHPGKLLSLFLCCPGSGTNKEWQQTEKEVIQLNRLKCTGWQWAKMGWNNLLGMLGSDRAYSRLFTQVMHNYHNDFIHPQEVNKSFALLRAEPINKTRPQIIQYPLLHQQAAPGFAITIVYGEKDIYRESKNFVLHRYPTAAVKWIRRCGHIPWLHNPDDYAAILNQHYADDRH